MDDIDPETEALLRQHHRELNGLTRTRHRSALPPDFPGKRKCSSKNPSQSGTPTQNDSSGNKRPRPDASISGEEQQQQQQEQHPRLKRLRKQEDGKERSSGALEPQASAHLQLAPRGSSLQDKGAATAAQEVNGHPKQGSQDRFDAAASAAAADARAKAQHVTAEPQPARIKCFYAGVRWGLMLPPEALASRKALATSLTAAYSQDGVHCGKGDRLHVLFLDKDGKTSDFPPRAEAGWGTAARYACRVYVRT